MPMEPALKAIAEPRRRAILELVRALKLKLVVEGVENPEQLEVLRSHGALTGAQGS